MLKAKIIYCFILAFLMNINCSQVPDYSAKNTTQDKIIPSGTLVINDNYYYTQTINASLTIAVDNAYEMCFSTDGTTYTAWEPYDTTKSVTLPSGHGEKTVYGKFRNADGESIIRDTIIPLVEEKIVASDGSSGALFGGGDWGYTTSNVFLSSDGNVMITASVRNNKVYIYRKNLNIWTETTLTNPECTLNEYFGQSLTCTPDGQYLVVGAINKACLYIYRLIGTTYTLESKIISPTPTVQNDYSVTLSISDDGSKLLVGSWNFNTYTGRAFLYEKTGSDWTVYSTTNFARTGGVTLDVYGLGIKISGDGNTIAIGAIGMYSNKGSLFVYRWNGSGWTGFEYQASNGVSGDYLGRHISMSYNGNRIITGTRIYNSGNSNQSSAYLFEWNGTGFSEAEILKASDGMANDKFGFCVAMSSDGNSVVISSPFNMGSSENGKAYVFRYRNSAWVEEAIISATDGLAGEFFGNITAISGDGSVIAVSASLDNIGSNGQQGSVYLYY